MILPTPSPPPLTAFDPRSADDGFAKLKAKVYSKWSSTQPRQASGPPRPYGDVPGRAKLPIVHPASSPSSHALQRRIQASQSKQTAETRNRKDIEENRKKVVKSLQDEPPLLRKPLQPQSSPSKPPVRKERSIIKPVASYAIPEKENIPPKSKHHSSAEAGTVGKAAPTPAVSLERTIDAPEETKRGTIAGQSAHHEPGHIGAKATPPPKGTHRSTLTGEGLGTNSNHASLHDDDKLSTPELHKDKTVTFEAIFAEDNDPMDVDAPSSTQQHIDTLTASRDNAGFEFDLDIDPNSFLNLDSPVRSSKKDQQEGADAEVENSHRVSDGSVTEKPAATESSSAPPFPRSDAHFKLPDDATPRTKSRMQKLEDERLGLSESFNEQDENDIEITRVGTKEVTKPATLVAEKDDREIASVKVDKSAPGANTGALDKSKTTRQEKQKQHSYGKKVGFVDNDLLADESCAPAPSKTKQIAPRVAPIPRGRRRPIDSVLSRPRAGADDDVFGFGNAPKIAPKLQKKAQEATKGPGSLKGSRQSVPMGTHDNGVHTAKSPEDSYEELPALSQVRLEKDRTSKSSQQAAETGEQQISRIESALEDSYDELPTLSQVTQMKVAKPKIAAQADPKLMKTPHTVASKSGNTDLACADTTVKLRNAISITVDDEEFADLRKTTAKGKRGRATTAGERKRATVITPARKPRTSKSTPASGVKHPGSASSTSSSKKRTLELDPHSSPTAEQSRGPKVVKTPLKMQAEDVGRIGTKAANINAVSRGKAKERPSSRPNARPKARPLGKAARQDALSSPLAHINATQSKQASAAEEEHEAEPSDDYDWLPDPLYEVEKNSTTKPKRRFPTARRSGAASNGLAAVRNAK